MTKKGRGEKREPVKRETNEGARDRNSRGWEGRERKQSKRWRRGRKEREEGRKIEGKGERQGERRKDRIKEGGTDALAQGLALSQLMSG